MTVNLSFRYAELDYVRALRAHYATRLRLRLDGAIAIAVGAYGIYLWRYTDEYWFALFCMGAAVFLILMLVAAFLIIPPLAFRREPKFRDEYSLTFSEEGVHFRTAHIDSHLQWKMYSRALIDKYSYVLYYGSNHFSVIPKRVFQSAEQQATFEELLKRYVPEIVRRG